MRKTGVYLLGLCACVVGCAGPTDSAETADGEIAALDARSSTCRPHSGETIVHAVLQVDQYRGVHSGHSGDHEVVEATVTSVLSAADPSLLDSHNVEVAMNVRSDRDPDGLPQEVRMAVGDSFEVEGRFIPAATAHAHNANGTAAVLHFTHAPCGFAKIAGQIYR